MLDDLYICNVCDGAGVLDLIRSSGRHTEKHHLIRCLAPEKADGKASPTEQRLKSIEGCLDGMQTQLDDLTGRMGDLTDRFGDLNSRIGNIEQLLHRLVRVTEGRTA
jgi:predicted nuclease with TOPRIM domain